MQNNMGFESKNLGMEKYNAKLTNTQDFIDRYNYGVEAQKKFLKYITDAGIKPISMDSLTIDYSFPKIPHPIPDFEFNTCLFEIRRQDFYPTVFLGYTKKFKGWKKYSLETNKPIYFCMFSKDLNNIAYTNLSLYENQIYPITNKGGDLDYRISFKVFKSATVDDGMKDIIRIIK
jgi:hypothetical protein